ncbi:IclR family transcriptional regulator [Chelativorans sp. J32]|uniref:IclR family transcriptional regulator n=1 Tax=Chelativorans sp. J32 TaxID=935840 RepID=UPI0004882ACE|nr:IclR family transcriptional regulator [Chelativorans sp. J32]
MMTGDVEEEEGVEAGARQYRVNVLDRAVSILDALSRYGPSLTQTELAKLTGLHVSTCMRLLVNLRHHGFVTKDEDSGRYRLGYRLVALAEDARGNAGLVEVARPVMRDLCRAFNETVVLSVVSGDYRVDLEQVVGRQSIRRVVALGVEKPLYAGAAGRLLLSGFSEAELENYLKRVELEPLAPQTITEPAALRSSIMQIRKDGYAEGTQEQYPDSGYGIVAPVCGLRGEIIAALGVSVPRFRFTEELRSSLLPAVLAAAEEVSRRMHGS